MAIEIQVVTILSMLAAGIVQNTFVGEDVEGQGGEEETTGGYFSTSTFTAQAIKSSVRNRRKYILYLELP